MPLPSPSSLRPALVLCLLLQVAPWTRADQATDPLPLAQWRGQVVLVDFWASWCKPCRQSFPWLNELQRKYAGRGLVIVGINVDRSATDAQRFLRDTPADFTILYDPDGTVAARFDVPGMPSSYLIGRDGRTVSRHVGFREGARAEREAEIAQLLSLPNARTP